MIKCLQICDNQGSPFYTRVFDDFPEIEGALLSGLVSAIGMIGKQVFNKDIATVSFGDIRDDSFMVIIQKDFLQLEKSIYFVFYTMGECNHKLINEIATSLFIETKQILRNPQFGKERIADKVDRIIDTKFGSLNYCI